MKDERGILEIADGLIAELEALPKKDAVSLRAVRRKYSRILKQRPVKEMVKLALKLIEEPTHPRRYAAYELLECHPGAIQQLKLSQVRALGKGIDSWGAVDMFSGYVAGQVWRHGGIGDAEIARWARSSDRWWRRAALVATVPLNAKAQGGEGDTKRTLAVCRMLMDDRDDMVVKAYSWALRVLSRTDTQAVKTFIEENRDRLAARVVREVTNKLTTGLKNPKKE
ncbi:MAG TPA: DNA alkylation repair protein [candidate division Zixibacteria bacterium]|nr:DNA alkylation repair protein [candidate division Zixibacteria bacterium]